MKIVLDIPEVKYRMQEMKHGKNGQLTEIQIAEKDAIAKSLAAEDWNITNTAHRVKLARNTLLSKMRRYQIAVPKKG